MPEAIIKANKFDIKNLFLGASYYAVYYWHSAAVANPPAYFGSIAASIVATYTVVAFKAWFREQAALMWLLPGGTHCRVLFMNSDIHDIPVKSIHWLQVSQEHIRL